LAQIPFFSEEPEKPKEEEYRQRMEDGILLCCPPTQYSRVGKRIIKAESLGGRSSLFKEAKENEKNHPILSWDGRYRMWCILQSKTRKDRFDAAARVMIVLGKEKSYRIFGGGNLSG